jgi:hypothetical protein
VRDVVRVDGREQAENDEQDEDEPEEECGLIATQPAPGQLPWAYAGRQTGAVVVK